MITIEHRRHTMRTKPGQHLSQAGVDLARAVGNSLGRFERVITSTLPRAFETAIALGYAVDEQRSELSTLPDGFEAEAAWDAGFARLAEAVRHNPTGAVAHAAHLFAELHREIASALPPDGRALVISHGGIVEISAIGCAPALDYAAWGPFCNYCEGARLHFEGTRCVKAEPLRVG